MNFSCNKKLNLSAKQKQVDNGHINTSIFGVVPQIATNDVIGETKQYAYADVHAELNRLISACTL